jgi:hypothetical protein
LANEERKCLAREDKREVQIVDITDGFLDGFWFPKMALDGLKSV